MNTVSTLAQLESGNDGSSSSSDGYPTAAGPFVDYAEAAEAHSGGSDATSEEEGGAFALAKWINPQYLQASGLVRF